MSIRAWLSGTPLKAGLPGSLEQWVRDGGENPAIAIYSVLVERPDLQGKVMRYIKQQLHPDREGGDERLFKLLAEAG